MFALLALLAAARADRGVDPAADAAEADRLQVELGQLAARGAWAGVDRAYVALDLLPGLPPTAADHALGAAAARALGDLGSERSRLLASVATGDAPAEVRSRLRELAGTVGRVVVEGHGRLVPVDVPGLDAPRAAAWAQAELDATGRFEGLLPRGTWQLGDARVQVGR